MNARLLSLCGLLIAAAAPSQAQSFAGLGDGAEGFAPVLRGVPVSLPADLQPHPDFQLEWWYITANMRCIDADAEAVDRAGTAVPGLADPDMGEAMGLQWTVFRRADRPGPLHQGWDSSHFWMAHAALTTADTHRVSETLVRSPMVTWSGDPFSLTVDGWSLRADPEEVRAQTPASSAHAYPGQPVLQARYDGADFGYDVRLVPTGPATAHGDRGFSQKSEAGQASYYISQPFFALAGTVRRGDRLCKANGTAWLDREWSSQPLDAGQTGWDWFSLHLPGGEKVMLFQLRSNVAPPYVSGSWIYPSGRVEPLKPADIVLTPGQTSTVAGRDIPTHWQITVPPKGLNLQVKALNDKSWMETAFPYWEGPIGVIGNLGATAIAGSGYLEMTGY